MEKLLEKIEQLSQHSTVPTWNDIKTLLLIISGEDEHQEEEAGEGQEVEGQKA